MSGPGASTLNLTIYIDTSLLSPGDLANLTFARVVGGHSNVIFQSIGSPALLKSNSFAWEQAYQIGATETFTGGVRVSSSTSRRDINYGYACNWENNDLQPATPVPPSWPTGVFGTTGLPSTLKNAIFGSTGLGPDGKPVFSPIYADAAPIPGMTNRSYSVDNSYIVSWEASGNSTTAGVYVKEWTNPFAFEYTATQANGYVSWGPPAAGGEPQWYWYGDADPGQHDPSKSKIPNVVALASAPARRDFGDDPLPNGTVQLSLGWDNMDWLSVTGKAQYATKVAKFLQASKPSYLDLYTKLSFPPKLTVSASLDKSNPIYDLLDGTTSDQKTTLILQSLVRGTTVKYAPSEQNFVYNDDLAVETLGNFLGLINLAWKFLGSNGAAIAAVAVPVAVKFLKAQIDAKYGGYKTVNIQVTSPSVTGAQGSASINISGAQAKDVIAILNGCNALLNTEAARKQAPPNSDPNLPTPDPLTYKSTNPSTGGAAGVLVIPTVTTLAPIKEKVINGCNHH